MISTVCWVGRGVAKGTPIKFMEAPEDENDDETAPAPTEGEATEEKMEESSSSQEDSDPEADVNTRYKLDDYDDEEETVQFGEDMETLLKYDPRKDPHVKSSTIETMNDMDDFLIRDTDLMILTGVTEDEEISHLDVYIFESVSENAYVHHDYLLPAFPLCMAWLDYPVGAENGEQKANMVAVGTFEPYIEIWDLDIVDCPSPAAILGGPEDLEELGMKKKLKLTKDSHKDSVLGLSWNRNQRNALASASADHTVKIWDLQSATCLKTFSHHKDKVQAVQWNPCEAPLLATGGFDSRIHILDVRTEGTTMCGALSADVECIQWVPSPYHNCILVSTEDGLLQCFDIMKGLDQPLWKLHAHSKPVHAVAVNERMPGLIATGSVDPDGPLKVWDISKGSPVCLASNTNDLGPVF